MRHHLRPLFMPVAAALLLTAVPGCGLFKPTEPEPPSGGVVQTDYTEPARTLLTLDRAIEDKGRTTGQTAYLDGLADPARDGIEFEMIPLPSVVQKLENAGVTVTLPWSHALEGSFYTRLIGFDAGDYSVQWSPDTRFSDSQDFVGADDAELNRIYLVQAGARTIAKGYARLVFKRLAGGRWVVVTWEERDVEPGDNEALTFSELRLRP